MVIEDGKFYFIKDEFFDVFKDYGLMVNKENGNKRPCYFCFRDRQNKEIIWFVPISTKYDKYKKIYDIKKVKSGKRPVYNFVFGNVLGKKAVFLIQNIFPTTIKYIEKKYRNSNMDVEIPEIVKEEVITKALRVVNLAEDVFDDDPFQSIDQVGVGKLVKMAVELGKQTRPSIKLGICGEHGGDPKSIEFCNAVGLQYVSCSPFRVPIARLAAAQAAIKQK